jgi:hypothetical protein
LDWLVQQITLFGVPFQNWTLIAFAIVALGVLTAWKP